MVRLRQPLAGVLIPAFLLLAAAATSCRQLPEIPGESVEILQQGELAAINPNDVVVGPVRQAAEISGAVPDRALREGFCMALIRRQYVPLSLDEVDKRVVDASYSAGYMNEDAVFEIIVHEWDDGQAETNGNIDVVVEARMLAVDKPHGPALWAAKIQKTYSFAKYKERLVTDSASMKALCKDLAWDLLEVMEKRDTSAMRG